MSRNFILVVHDDSVGRLGFGVNVMKNKFYLWLYNNLDGVGRIFCFLTKKGCVEEVSYVIRIHVHVQISYGIDLLL